MAGFVHLVGFEAISVAFFERMKCIFYPAALCLLLDAVGWERNDFDGHSSVQAIPRPAAEMSEPYQTLSFSSFP